MSLIEISEKLLMKIKEAFNQSLKEQNKRIEVIDEAKELPSPLPRLSKNEKFLDELDALIEKHYPGSKMVGVTDTNSMEPLVDIGHKIVLIPFKETEKKSIIEGDIVWFHRIKDGSPNVLHRVIRKEDGWIVTLGDNLVENDGPTANKNIKGFAGMVIY